MENPGFRLNGGFVVLFRELINLEPFLVLDLSARKEEERVKQNTSFVLLKFFF